MAKRSFVERVTGRPRVTGTMGATSIPGGARFGSKKKPSWQVATKTVPVVSKGKKVASGALPAGTMVGARVRVGGRMATLVKKSDYVARQAAKSPTRRKTMDMKKLATASANRPKGPMPMSGLANYGKSKTKAMPMAGLAKYKSKGKSSGSMPMSGLAKKKPKGT